MQLSVYCTTTPPSDFIVNKARASGCIDIELLPQHHDEVFDKAKRDSKPTDLCQIPIVQLGCMWNGLQINGFNLCTDYIVILK